MQKFCPMASFSNTRRRLSRGYTPPCIRSSAWPAPIPCPVPYPCAPGRQRCACADPPRSSRRLQYPRGTRGTVADSQFAGVLGAPVPKGFRADCWWTGGTGGTGMPVDSGTPRYPSVPLSTPRSTNSFNDTFAFVMASNRGTRGTRSETAFSLKATAVRVWTGHPLRYPSRCLGAVSFA
jgi:hypothetical protein